MSEHQDDLRGLSASQKKAMLRRMVRNRSGAAAANGSAATATDAGGDAIPESHYRFDKFPLYQQIHAQRDFARNAGIDNPFFVEHEGCAADTTLIDGEVVLDFATYNYLGLNNDPRVLDAVRTASDRHGVSASASRIVSGERPPHRELERRLAELHGVDDAVAFVSGHATNVSTIATLLGPNDLILHDRYIHDSQLQGARLSGATRRSFPHNDMAALESILARERARFEKVLICVEGLYSMDGDVAPLPRLMELKTRHKALLMVDEAHSVGVVGERGAGLAEHFDVDGRSVDIWMGTLSKSLCGCGGYIAGPDALVEMLKCSAPGFVYSVGMPPPVAAACSAALDAMWAEPWRVDGVRENGRVFLDACRERGLNTGNAEGFCVVPVIVGSSVLAARLANALFQAGVNVQPIIYPAVEEDAARLRFFLSAEHTAEQLVHTADLVADELTRLRDETM